MPDEVDPDEVRHVAELARVALDEGDADRFAEQFVDVLEAFDSLEAVPDVDREAELDNVFRTDEVRESLEQTDALANAPETEAGHFRGPPVS